MAYFLCEEIDRSRRWGVDEFKHLYTLVYQQRVPAISSQQQRGKRMYNPSPTLPNNPPPPLHLCTNNLFSAAA